MSAMGNGSACMAKHLNHVAIAVEDMDEALGMYGDLFGLDPSEVEDVEEQGVRAALLQVGGSQLELIQPLDKESGVAKFIERRGPGLHHVCFEVDGLQGALDRLDAEEGVQLIDRSPRQGLGRDDRVPAPQVDGRYSNRARRSRDCPEVRTTPVE